MEELLRLILLELSLTVISLALFLWSLLTHRERTREILPALLLVVWFLSAVGGIVRYYAKIAVERRCTWRRVFDDRQVQQDDQERVAQVHRRRGSITASVALFRDGRGIDDNDADNDNDMEDGDKATSINNNTNTNNDNVNSHTNNNYGTSRAKTRMWSEVVRKFLQPSRSSLFLLHGPSLTLLLYLTIRLCATRNFRTEPVDLNFGPSPNHPPDSGMYCMAFNENTASFLRAFCGFLAAFLSFPAVGGTLARSLANCCRNADETALFTDLKCVRALLSLLTLAFSLLTLYPAHNLLRHILDGDAVALASTAYSLQCTEWIVGYVVGVVEGLLVTSVAGRLLVVDLPSRHEGGLVGYMKTFEVTIREEKTREELEGEWRNQMEKRKREEREREVYVREVWDDHAETEKEEKDANPIASNTTKTEKKYAFGKLEEYTMTRPDSRDCTTVLHDIYHVDVLVVTRVLSTLPLMAFALSVLVAGVYMGTSWNVCVEGKDKCINSTAGGGVDTDDSTSEAVDMDGLLVYPFVGLFGVVMGVFWWVARKKHGPFQCRW